ncbi:response regulator [Actinoplanes sp. NPDC026623]|uniref:response regulator n=1 Tax=Actinoplanes sp. NPDC026623 TaxID=3155610 RepID=UPI0033DE7C1B
MSIDWSPLVLLAAEFMFAVLFVRALSGYLHGRDPLQRDVTLVFAPFMVLFCADVTRRIIGGVLPYWIGAAALLAVLIQPYLTVRLAARLRQVPRRLHLAVLGTFVVTAAPLAFADRPRPLEVWALAWLGFVAAEIVAAWLLFGKARTRSGANRARLMTAAFATLTFGATIVLLGIGSLDGADSAFRTASRGMALVSAVGYLIAFLPPRWLRRAFSASAAQSVTERLLRTPVESPEQVWQTYAEIMRVQTGADAVTVLMPRADGMLAPAAYSGPPIATPHALGAKDITALIRAGRPARLREGGAALVRHYGDDLVTVLSMPVPPDAEGAVLLVNRHRSLFRDDDLRLLAALGGQAGIIAERQAVTSAHRRMAVELSASVEALTRASQAKSSFLANMSHELRTPLNAIIGFSDLMRLEEPDGDRRRVPADWIDHIHSSGRHLLGLINDILDLAKIEAGRLDLRLAPLRVDAAITELLTGLSPLLTSKHLTVTTRLPEATVLADRVRFRQIAENLLSNAIKFTPEGGSIFVSVAPAGDDLVDLTVADTGVGIAEADRDRVFEEFQQVGDPERHRSGTGLGLALTKRLVTAHGGEITLLSAPGEGSAFTVRLPAASVLSFEEGPAAGAHVLLVEDDPQSAELLSTQLAGAGYHVDVAGTGEAGLTAAGAHPPDAIVLDVALPGIDGFEVIRRLKAEPRLAAIPVFFVTIIDERQAGLALGAQEYFVKPVDQAALLGALAKAMARRPTPRVLVVDHDDRIREAIEQGLRAGGADVVACADGRDGLALSREGHFDLIVCDMQSPDVDGFSMLTAIEQDPATRHTPVLGLTPAGAAPAPGEAGPLVATAMAGGVVATAMAGGAGWETLAPLLSGAEKAVKDEREIP